MTKAKIQKAKDDIKTYEEYKLNIGDMLITKKYELCELEERGSEVCDDEKKKAYIEKAKEEMKATNVEFVSMINKITVLLKHLEASDEWNDNVYSMWNTENKYYKMLKNEKEIEQQKGAISNRMANFYNKKFDTVKNISFYLKILYWICFGIILFIVFWKRQYDDVRYWPMIAIFLLFPLIFMKSIMFQAPIINKPVKITSIFDYVYENFEHFKIDNIYLTSIVLMSGLIGIFTLASMWPFKNAMIMNPE